MNMHYSAILLTFTLMLGSCTRVEENSRVSRNGPAPDDKAVIATVLDHFSKRTDTSSLRENGLIVIEPRTTAWSEGPFSGLAAMEDQDACETDQSLYDRFVERNKAELAADSLVDSAERWRIATPSELEQFPLGVTTSDGKPLKTIMSLYAPAFSSDGTQAYILLGFSWSIHGAHASYVLDWTHDRWKVRCSLLNFSV